MTRCLLIVPIIALVLVWPASSAAVPEGISMNDRSNHARPARSLSNGVGVWQLLGGKQYFISLSSVRKSWQGATEYCSSIGSQLLSLDTASKSNRIARHYADYDGHSHRVWTSGSDVGHEERFKWTATEMFFTEGPWAQDEPDNDGGNEHCVMATFKMRPESNATMFTKDCASQYMFICELPRGVVTVSETTQRNPPAPRTQEEIERVAASVLAQGLNSVKSIFRDFKDIRIDFG